MNRTPTPRGCNGEVLPGIRLLLSRQWEITVFWVTSDSFFRFNPHLTDYCVPGSVLTSQPQTQEMDVISTWLCGRGSSGKLFLESQRWDPDEKKLWCVMWPRPQGLPSSPSAPGAAAAQPRGKQPGDPLEGDLRKVGGRGVKRREFRGSRWRYW